MYNDPSIFMAYVGTDEAIAHSGDLPVGAFITAVVAFLILAFVVYFFVVKPYTAMRARFVAAEEETTDESVELLREIRDSLRAGRA